MAKINTRPGLERTFTHEGAPAIRQSVQKELLLTAATTYLGEDTFYERGTAATPPQPVQRFLTYATAPVYTIDQGGLSRQERLIELVHAATKRDPIGTRDTIYDTRKVFNIRTAPMLMAVEYLRAGGPDPRTLIDSVCQRADEPAEIIAYWLKTGGGKSLPWAMRKGLADAMRRLYNERNVLKYNARNAAVLPGDAIELVHPKPVGPAQSALFKWLLDERHHHDGNTQLLARFDDTSLPMLKSSALLGMMPEDDRRLALRTSPTSAFTDAGYTWERLSGWLPGGMDAEAWEAIIPSMQVMALIRNLRNFDQVGISEASIDTVIAKITSEEDVRRSGIFPYRVWSAYKNAPSDNWGRALGKTLELTVPSVPDFSNSLILIDFSSSMEQALSARGSIGRWEVASLMALAAAHRSSNVDVGVFGSTSQLFTPTPGASILKEMFALSEGFANNRRAGWGGGGLPGTVGHSTHGHTAIKALFDPAKHKQVLMFTDDQMHDDQSLSRHVPKIVTFNLGGYAPQSNWGKGRYAIGGFNDAVFKIAAEL